MARRSRSNRRPPLDGTEVLRSPYVRRSLAYFDPLDDEQLAKMDEQVDWLLENVGIAFRDDPVALEIWREAGVIPTGDMGDLIKADAKFIRNLCAKAPREFTQLARNPDRSVSIGGNSQVFAPIYGAPFVRDLKGGRRYGDMDSFEKLVKLNYMHPNFCNTNCYCTYVYICSHKMFAHHINRIMHSMTKT